MYRNCSLCTFPFFKYINKSKLPITSILNPIHMSTQACIPVEFAVSGCFPHYPLGCFCHSLLSGFHLYSYKTAATSLALESCTINTM